jgi:DNA processing protein
MTYTLPDDELRASLRLMRMPGVGAKHTRIALERAGSACAALHAGPAFWAGLGLPPPGPLDAVARASLDQDLRWLDAPRHRLLRYDHPEFPPLLAHSSNPPTLLFARGDPALALRAQLAVVGSRHASRAGLAHTRDFVIGLARAGLVVTSGLARGVDAAAHRAALDAGTPTIAVCGTGLDVCYPSDHAALADEIAASGVLFSEFPLGTPPRAEHFPQRNRIIAGMALGVLVMEADLRSGSLITARLAAEAGRNVFAVPGPIDHAKARGCHRLIRDGAILVESAQDVLDELVPLAGALGACLAARIDVDAPRAAATRKPDDPVLADLLDALRGGGADVHELGRRSAIDSARMMAALTTLELDGRIVRDAHGRYDLTR